jgi:integrase/recombinase XerD
MDSSTRPVTPLRQRMLEDMRMRKMADDTQDAYILAVRKLAAFLRRSPDTANAEELRRFQLHLVETGTGPATINATLTGLRFFFGVTVQRPGVMSKVQPVRVPQTLPVVLSREEVSRLLAATHNPKHLAAMSVAYGTGLRASEVVSLKVGDVHSQRMTLRVEQGKGRKDRYAMLSPMLLERLREWWRVGRTQGKILPGGWLFPGLNPVDPLNRRQLNRVVHEAARRRDRQASSHAYVAPQLRHPPARRQGRHPVHPSDARPSEAAEHVDLHPRGHQAAARRDQPAADVAAATARTGAARVHLKRHRGAGGCRSRRHLPPVRPRVARRAARASESRPAQGHLGHRALSHGSAGWARAALRRLRHRAGLVQLLSQPPLSKVPERCRTALARGPAGRSTAGAVLPRRVHVAGAAGGDRLYEQGDAVRAPVRYRRRGLVDDRRRPSRVLQREQPKTRLRASGATTSTTPPSGLGAIGVSPAPVGLPAPMMGSAVAHRTSACLPSLAKKPTTSHVLTISRSLSSIRHVAAQGNPAAKLLQQGQVQSQGRGTLQAEPNPSFEARSDGIALGPRGALVHDAPRGPSAIPSVPPQLER